MFVHYYVYVQGVISKASDSTKIKQKYYRGVISIVIELIVQFHKNLMKKGDTTWMT